jgi:hypothetical protein
MVAQSKLSSKAAQIMVAQSKFSSKVAFVFFISKACDNYTPRTIKVGFNAQQN